MYENKLINHRYTQMDTEVNKEFLYKELTKEIINSAYCVQNQIGCGLLEKVYENSLIRELELRNIKVIAQKEFRVIYREKEVGKYYADLIVDDKVIVEVKVVEEIDNIHRAQIINYLKISGLKVGLILNFSKSKLKYERLVV